MSSINSPYLTESLTRGAAEAGAAAARRARRRGRRRWRRCACHLDGEVNRSSGSIRHPARLQSRPMASPHTTALTDAIHALVDASVAADTAAVRTALETVEHRVGDVPRRVSVPLDLTFTVFGRDSWTCRYCGGKTVAMPVLRALSSLYPDEFPHHPNWKAGQVHPAYLLISTSLDHRDPGTRGGRWRDPENLVTACWPCNRQGRLHARRDRLDDQDRRRGPKRLDRPHRALPGAVAGGRRAGSRVPP
jgi:5-methylcytosine-specific restriction endonuclease McrA